MKFAPQAALLDGMDTHSHPQSEVRTFACNIFLCSGWWRLFSFLYKPEDDVLKLFNAAGLWNVKFLRRTRVGFPR